MNRLCIKITGPAGCGIKVTGLMLAKIFIRQGLNVFGYTEYPSLIRGGHNTYQVDVALHPERVATKSGQVDGSLGNKPLTLPNSISDKSNILIALDKKSIQLEIDNIRDNGMILCDESFSDALKTLNPLENKKVKLIAVPFIELAKRAGGEIMRNTVASGSLMAILDLPLDKLNQILKEEFKDKGEVVEKNVIAARYGWNFVKDNNEIMKYRNNNVKVIKKLETINKKLGNGNILITGNQACALGIIASQCQIYVAYPMTPSTEILHFLEAKQRETGMIVHQPEDEIAGIHAALGGSFAGVRTAVGTSGGGFALMNEGLSLAGMVELPVVIFEVQRPGPATGNPTWTEQGDLSYVLNSGHGEFPRVIIAPGNPEQCFKLTQHAFNLADKYQVPVIILSDKFLGESSYTVSRDVFSEIEDINRGKIISNNETMKQYNNYRRYLLTIDGVSPRTIPGVSNGEHIITSAEHHENGIRCGEFIANSDEHNELSFSDESAIVRKNMMDKRMKKLEGVKKEIPLPEVYGPKNTGITLVCWGSMLGPCLDAMEMINKSKINPVFNTGQKSKIISKLKIQNINVLHFSYIWPLPKNLDKFLNTFKKLVLVENNKTGQLGKLIRQETGIEIKDKILKYNSRPFWPEEIVTQLSP